MYLVVTKENPPRVVLPFQVPDFDEAKNIADVKGAIVTSVSFFKSRYESKHGYLQKVDDLPTLPRE